MFVPPAGAHLENCKYPPTRLLQQFGGVQSEAFPSLKQLKVLGMVDPIDEYGVFLDGLLCHEVDCHEKVLCTVDPIDEYGVILEGLLCHEVDWHNFDSDGMKDISKGDSLQTKRPRCAKGP